MNSTMEPPSASPRLIDDRVREKILHNWAIQTIQMVPLHVFYVD